MNKKTLLVAILTIAIIACMAVGFVGCGATLDGSYACTVTEAGMSVTSTITIAGDKLTISAKVTGMEEMTIMSTTFTKKDKTLTLVIPVENIGSPSTITVKNSKTLEMKGKGADGKETTVAYTKVVAK